MKEFEIIQSFFKNLNSDNKTDSDIDVDIGDDCAVLNLSNIDKLLVTTDTLVNGVHFLDTAPAYSLGYKSLAVNLSDIAAMGGVPKWFTLSLTLPNVDLVWLRDFTNGLASLANKYNVALIGGDLSSGSLSITITAFGTKSTNILTRSQAKIGNGIFVTGNLGYAKFMLDMILDKPGVHLSEININSMDNKLYYPEPNIKAGMFIADYATSAIDISDGLLADLGHILKQSKVSAEIFLDKLPIDSRVTVADKYNYSLTSGDEYEILFTAPLEYTDILLDNKHQAKITHIGNILAKNDDDKNNIIFLNSLGEKINLTTDNCWQHFNENK